MIRGQYDRPGEKVTRNVPAALPPLADAEAPTRLDLARWLVAPENPLTARVDREPALAAILRLRPGENVRRFRLARRAAEPSRVARLAGGGI